MRALLLALLLLKTAGLSSASFWSTTNEGGLKYDEDLYQCPDDDSTWPSTVVCNGFSECYKRNDMDEGSELCAPKAYLLQDLFLTASRITHNSAFLTWSSGRELPEQREASLKLSGYRLTVRSQGHSFQTILEPTLTEYNMSCLKSWKEYKITLRRFYPNDRSPHPPIRLGRAAAVAVRTKAHTPATPSGIEITSARQGEVNLRIVDPLYWNGLPQKYYVRWEPRNQQNGHPGRSELDIPSTRPRHQNWMGMSLSLEPGVRYRLFVSAENAGEEHNITFRGPEISWDVASIPMGPNNLSVDSLSSHELLVSWGVSGSVEFFRVNVSYYDENPDFREPSQPHHSRNHHRYGMNYITTTPAPRLLKTVRAPIVVDGEGSESSVRSVIVDELPPSKKCTVEVEACSSSGCSGALSTWAITKRRAVPEPVITNVESNSSSSFKIAWSFYDDDTSYYDGFLVHYCSAASFCRDYSTHLKSFSAVNLSADTSFDIQVRARMKHSDGRVELGPSAKAQVSTWKEVPLEPGLEVRASGATLTRVALSWTFVNSTVDYLQVSKEGDIWMSCTDDAGCDAAVMGGWRPQFKTGFITLRDLEPYTLYAVSLRGCNDAGCGKKTTVHVRTGTTAPNEPAELKVLSHNDITVVTWDRPPVPAGPLSGYLVSWQCPSREKHSTTVEGFQLSLKDLPQGGSNCTFWVSGFNQTPEGHLLIGTAAAVSLS